MFTSVRACIRIWCTAGAVERRSQMFVYRLSPFPFPLLAIFSLFPLTVWLSVLLFWGFTWIPIHASAIILFSLCSELVTCTSFVREYAKNWFHRFLLSSVLKVLRVIWMPAPAPTPLFRLWYISWGQQAGSLTFYKFAAFVPQSDHVDSTAGSKSKRKKIRLCIA